MHRADLAPFMLPPGILRTADGSLKQPTNLKGPNSVSQSWCTDRPVRRSGHAANKPHNSPSCSYHHSKFLVTLTDCVWRFYTNISAVGIVGIVVRGNGVAWGYGLPLLAVALAPFLRNFLFLESPLLLKKSESGQWPLWRQAFGHNWCTCCNMSRYLCECLYFHLQLAKYCHQ